MLLARCYIIGTLGHGSGGRNGTSLTEICRNKYGVLQCFLPTDQLPAFCALADGKVNNTYSEVVAACFGRNAVTAIGV